METSPRDVRFTLPKADIEFPKADERNAFTWRNTRRPDSSNLTLLLYDAGGQQIARDRRLATS